MEALWIQTTLLISFAVMAFGVCPENLQYGEGKCCSKCGPGLGVESACSSGNDTNCVTCEESLTFSPDWSYQEKCLPCKKCIKNSHVVRECNLTHDTVCECNPNFYYDPESDMCKLCEPCAPGTGSIRQCSSVQNTICEVCPNGTFSDVLSPTSVCLPCSVCEGEQVTLQACSPKEDTLCLAISRPKPTVAIIESKPKQVVSTDGINVIPLYCALMAAIVVGLLVYVVVKNFRRGKDTKRFITKQPHDDIEYAAAEKGDSGIYVEPEVKTSAFSHSLKVREIPYSRRREVEQCLCVQKDKRASWKILARELGFTRAKVATIEHQAELEMIEPAVYMFTEWSKSDSATVGAFLRGLKKVGRTDIARVLNGDTSELRPLNDGSCH